MHLKTLELVGFKSFANRTRLHFEPGMTAIVGPNGCGKSNVADAVRWVLGEQSAKALRGAKMDDCIFNGTDSKKPLGMAEVSITFTNCDGVLETEYHEVTITRRILRDGTGQYFINKAPCRLKDIQRLFMDTGIGTTSYSLMEQGKIDRILSSRPEDRRTIFEEASGITKFKSDKKEALRKLEHTEANLLRLADVIREVKRQIGSLQRQAGKARRFKSIRDELRILDLHLSSHRLHGADKRIQDLKDGIEKLNTAMADLRVDLEKREANTTGLREALVRVERSIATAMETAVQARSDLNHTKQVIELNEQRIEENREMQKRDATEIEKATAQLEDRRTEAVRRKEEQSAAESELQKARAAEDEARKRVEKNDARLRELRQILQTTREKAMELEATVSRAQNQLQTIENSERSEVLRKERLATEKAQIARGFASYEKRGEELAAILAEQVRDIEKHEVLLKESREKRAAHQQRLQELREEHGSLQSESAAHSAQVELLVDKDHAGEGLPGGAQQLLAEKNPLSVEPGAVLGSLADHVSATPDYGRALEAILRAWADAIVVRDIGTSIQILEKLRKADPTGNIRLVGVQKPNGEKAELPANAPGEALLEHVTCSEELAPMVHHALAAVRVVDALTPDLPEGVTYVTRDGAVLRADGHHEFWTPDDAAATPLSRKHQLAEGEAALAVLKQQMAEKQQAIQAEQTAIENVERSIAGMEQDLQDRRRTHAQREGELQLVADETKRLNERLDTVTWELKELTEQGSEYEQEKTSLRKEIDVSQQERGQANADIEKRTRELHELEAKQTEAQHVMTDKRIAAGAASTRCGQLRDIMASVAHRIGELEAAVEGRSAGMESYEKTMAALAKTNEELKQRLVTLAEQLKQNETDATKLRKQRDAQSQELAKAEAELAARRKELESWHEQHSKLDIQLAEQTMRRETQVERVTSTYGVTLDEVMKHEPPPEVEDMPMDLVETTVAELSTKLEAMGPVNLVAIEEHQELQERYDFLSQQEQDLVTSKAQLMDMIRDINKTSSDLFKETFDRVNTNFQQMFTQLFNGGTAKLVLVNEEDVLDCGIEIIARPPGKRLQNVSLLSGGERTMTAVGLLFSIYMIKPSPFCMLDELDAALDDSNIGRFVKVLESFVKQSQFVVITHNRQTIAAANVLYGVTMQEKGISNIVSLKFSDTEAPENAKQALVPAR